MEGVDMNCYGAKELAASFRTVRNNTITIAEEIPEGRYSFRAAPAVRSVAEMLAHIALGTTWHQDFHGKRHVVFSTEMFVDYMQQTMAAERELTTKAQIVARLKEEGDRFASFLDGLSDDVLAQSVAFPEPMNYSKVRLQMLLSVKEHEMHHRSQLMLIERMI